MSTNAEIRARIAADPGYAAEYVAAIVKATDPATTPFTQADQTRQLRFTIDFWWCHRGGANGSSMKGSWLPHSVAARAQRQTANGHGSGLVREHVVPLNLILNELWSGPPERTRYHDILSRLAVVALVTKEEDRRLLTAGLQTSHPDLSDPWSRYRLVGIEMEDTVAQSLELP